MDPDQVHQFLDMPAIYILKSQTNERFYIGSAVDAEIRLAEHERGQTKSTRGRGPWVLVYREAFDTIVEARRRERQFIDEYERSVRQAGVLLADSPEQALAVAELPETVRGYESIKEVALDEFDRELEALLRSSAPVPARTARV